MSEHHDVIVIGAGISGICAAHYLRERCPRHRFVILEGRDRLGGTWDLFRYPGIRSDSDMLTLGFSFRPWDADRSIAHGSSILRYLEETAEEMSLDESIRYGCQVSSAAWSSETATWTVSYTQAGETVEHTCRFLFVCAGYYDYEQPHTPDFPGLEHFEGRRVHPQLWPEDLDYRGKRVVVIGSGATAMTLVPAMARDGAAHVTMLQRSPTYVIEQPSVDPVWARLRERLGDRPAYQISRWKNIVLGMLLWQVARRAPGATRALLTHGVRRALDPSFDVTTHFGPRYDPWDQRLCLIPDGDLFETINAGQVSVVTDQVESFTASGIRLESGRELPAEIVVTATGLQLRFCGGISLSVDGKHVEPNEKYLYQTTMLSDVPNLALSFGYINASWTLRAELTCKRVCEILLEMERKGHRRAVARVPAGMTPEPLMGLSSGYVRRAMEAWPKVTSRSPWRAPQNYFLDMANLALGDRREQALQMD